MTPLMHAVFLLVLFSLPSIIWLIQMIALLIRRRNNDTVQRIHNQFLMSMCVIIVMVVVVRFAYVSLEYMFIRVYVSAMYTTENHDVGKTSDALLLILSTLPPGGEIKFYWQDDEQCMDMLLDGQLVTTRLVRDNDGIGHPVPMTTH